ncbi:uncharacterized protein LOC144655634 isoform X2 [Oculina patagonica]
MQKRVLVDRSASMALNSLRTVSNYEEFNAFLVTIADEITEEELKEMKFLCQEPNNNLPRGRLDRIKEPLHFVNFLREKGKIWPENVSYLVWLLDNIGNIRLADMIRDRVLPGSPSSPGVGRPGILPCLTKHFIGRDADVENIIKKLRTDSSRMVVVVSPPGMGKTQVAIRASQLLQREDCLNVIYVERQDRLIDICGVILDRLSSWRWSVSVDLVSQAKRKLSELQEDTVIVLDNTEDIQGKNFDDFAEWLVKYAPKVQLMITTREDVGFVSADIHKVHLKPLDVDSSTKLLQKLVASCPEGHVKEICELCGGVPLLLINCAVLLTEGFNSEILIRDLRDNPIEFLKFYAKDVYHELGRFIKKLTADLKKYIVFLSVFPSSFSAADIQFLFENVENQQRLSAMKIQLVTKGLLVGENDGKISLFPPVHAFCRAERESLNMADVGCAAQHKFNCHYLELLKRLSKNFISKNSAFAAVKIFREQKVNIMEALKNCLKDTSDAYQKGITSLALDTANSPEVLSFLANVLSPPNQCTTLYRKCCSIAMFFGDKKRQADSLNSLGFLRLCNLGQIKDDPEGNRETLEVFQEAHDIRKTLPEEEQKCETNAHTISKLGLCYLLRGEEEKGRSLVKHGIAMRKDLGVPLYVAAGYCDLGNVYQLCGDQQTAIELWKMNTLPVYKKELGDHPWTASIVHYIADSYKTLATENLEDGYAEQAEMYFREALELRQRLLGFHQDTARSHVSLSDVLVIRGEYPSALEQLERALEIQTDLLGPQHKITTDTQNKITEVLERLSCKEAKPKKKGMTNQQPLDGACEEPHSESIHPSYVIARGKNAVAAFQRALETGETFDKRVKVSLIGRDRVGKTSLGKALRGEQFSANEESTDGVQMHKPLKYAGLQPWKNSIMQEETTTYHHKCAEYISRELITESMRLQQTHEPQDSINKPENGPSARPINGEPDITTATETEHSALDINQETEKNGNILGDKIVLPSDEISGIVAEKLEEKEKDEKAAQEEKVPDEISGIVAENLDKKDTTNQEGIWPVIWDFAGQAVYRAIHPIFMSPESVHLLVVDLTKNLSAIAPCQVKEDCQEEVVIQAPDRNDTNLDHIMRWLDLVNSLRLSGSEELPPVILVGTHSDCVDNDPDETIQIFKDTLCHNARLLSRCVVATSNVDNTKAGQPHGQEDPRIISLRKKIIEVADAMPQTKVKFPLKWLQVENEVYQQAKKGAKYMTRRRFKLEIVDKICQLKEEDDFGHLLDFLQDRGTIVNHDRADNLDGLVVLDPQWLISVLCTIVSVKKKKDEGLAICLLRKDLGEKGILDPELLDYACSNLKLCNIKDSLLFIMKKFNLLCQCKGEDDETVYLVPCMLTAEPEENLIPLPAINSSQPVYITFDSNYVPSGLFSRLLVLFGEWAASRTSCKQQRLFANAARFVVGESTCLGLVCYKSVIKVHIWAMDQDSDPVHTTPTICAEVFRFLEESLSRLKRECHWLRLVSWKFCGQCRLCLGKVGPKTKKCFRHQKRDCNDDDCAHYVSVGDSPFCCTDAKGPDLRLPLTWIQVLKYKTSQEQPATKNETSKGDIDGSQDYNGNPPRLNFEVPKLSELPKACNKSWNDVELPVDFLLLTVEDCEFLGFFRYLEEPVKSYRKDIGYVLFGSMGSTIGSTRKMKIALMKCCKGSAVPGGSLTVVKNAVRILRPKSVFSVGACSGLNRGKVKLGDVVVSSRLMTPTHKTPASRDIGTLIRHAADGWKAPLAKPDALEVRVHCDGEFLSSPEVISEDTIQQYPDAIAIEREGEGIFAAAHDLKTEWVLIKGIKDFADGSQPASEEWRVFASVMAASVVANILSDPIVFAEWSHCNQI